MGVRRSISARPTGNAAVAAAVVCLLLLSGCRHGDRPPLGMVSGTVTLDGKPLADARVIFEPAEGGRASTGSTDAEGKYELIYIRKDKGAKLGPHLVRISVTNPDAANVELLPARYNAQTTLRADVKPGSNEINFTLTSGRVAIRPPRATSAAGRRACRAGPWRRTRGSGWGGSAC